jgi:hypothetical protein
MPLSKLRIGFDVAVLVFFAYIIWAASQFRGLAGYFPLVIASLAFVLGVVNLGVDLLKLRKAGSALAGSDRGTASIKEEAAPEERRRALARMGRYLGWTVGYVAAIWVFGMVVATPLFLFLFFLLDGRTGLLFAVLGSVGGTVALILASDIMNLRWPSSIFGFFT